MFIKLAVRIGLLLSFSILCACGPNAQKGLDQFAGVKPGLSKEKRLQFFKHQVAVSLDELSGAIVLRTVGLYPQASLNLNRFMLAKSEQFVNRLNQDISQKQLGFAESELVRARNNLNKAKNKLLIYQDSNTVIDPKGEAELASQTISKLQEKLVELRVQLATLKLQYKDPASMVAIVTRIPDAIIGPNAVDCMDAM
jgi:capsular polysaccharide transport system permease protein